MKNSIFLAFISFLILFNVNAQTTNNQIKNYSENPYWIEMMQDPSANFYETVEAFNQYWDGREVTKSSGYKPFKTTGETGLMPMVQETSTIKFSMLISILKMHKAPEMIFLPATGQIWVPLKNPAIQEPDNLMEMAG